MWLFITKGFPGGVSGKEFTEQTGSNSEKEDIKAAYCHPAYLTYMQGIS